MEKGVVSLTFLGPQAPRAPPPLGASLPRGQCLPFSWLSPAGPRHRPFPLLMVLFPLLSPKQPHRDGAETPPSSRQGPFSDELGPTLITRQLLNVK